jgi:hypothetical protein
MKISELPKEIATLATLRMEQDKRAYWNSHKTSENDDSLWNAFSWGLTQEGHEFWSLINDGVLERFYELYPGFIEESSPTGAINNNYNLV